MILTGTGAAMLAVPIQSTAGDALILPSGILAVSLLSPTIFSWRADVRRLLRGENVLLVALAYWILTEPLQGAMWVQLPRDTIVDAIFLVGLTGVAFWLGASVGQPWAPQFLMREGLYEWPPGMIFSLMLAAFFLGMWDFVYRADFDLSVMIDALLLPRFEAPWQREALGDWSAFSAHLVFFGYTVPSLAVLCIRRTGLRHPYAIVALLCAVTILVFNAQGGGRRIVGALVLSGLFCYLIDSRRMSIQRALITTVVVLGLVIVMQLMLIYRNVGFFDVSEPLSEYQSIHVDNNFAMIAQLIDYVPDNYPYVDWQYIFYALVRPIPRVFWPDKPIDGGFDLAEVIGIPNTSVALTVAGEFYLSHGYLATVLGGIVYGRLGTLANAMLERTDSPLNPVFPSLVLIWLFVGVRSMLEIMVLGYALLAMIVLSRLARVVRGVRSGYVNASRPTT